MFTTRNKKRIAVALACVMAAAFTLAGCSGGGSSDKPTIPGMPFFPTDGYVATSQLRNDSGHGITVTGDTSAPLQGAQPCPNIPEADSHGNSELFTVTTTGTVDTVTEHDPKQSIDNSWQAAPGQQLFMVTMTGTWVVLSATAVTLSVGSHQISATDGSENNIYRYSDWRWSGVLIVSASPDDSIIANFSFEGAEWSCDLRTGAMTGNDLVKRITDNKYQQSSTSVEVPSRYSFLDDPESIQFTRWPYNTDLGWADPGRVFVTSPDNSYQKVTGIESCQVVDTSSGIWSCPDSASQYTAQIDSYISSAYWKEPDRIVSGTYQVVFPLRTS